MNKIFIVLTTLTSTLLFSQNVDEAKFNQLSKTISENGCDCIQQVKNSNGDWVNSVESCFLESFKKNEQKVKQVLGANYLEEENGQNILQLINLTEGYWGDVCLDKLKTEEAFSLNLVYYFNDNLNLTYDLTELYNQQFSEGENVSQDEEFDVVFVKSYEDEYKDMHIVFKDENNETFDMFILDENNTIMPLLNKKQIKANQKLRIMIRQTDLLDEETNENITALFVVNLEKL